MSETYVDREVMPNGLKWCSFCQIGHSASCYHPARQQESEGEYTCRKCGGAIRQNEPCRTFPADPVDYEHLGCGESEGDCPFCNNGLMPTAEKTLDVSGLFLDTANKMMLEWREMKARESEGVVVEIRYTPQRGYTIVGRHEFIAEGTYRLTRMQDGGE